MWGFLVEWGRVVELLWGLKTRVEKCKRLRFKCLTDKSTDVGGAANQPQQTAPTHRIVPTPALK